jgi:hypothetical protein
MAQLRFSRVFAVIATIVLGVALVRLADAVGKRELGRAARELVAEDSVARAEYDAQVAMRDRLMLDNDFLGRRIQMMSKREPYLVVSRQEGKLMMGMENRILLETKFRLRGPVSRNGDDPSLLRATLEVLAKRTSTDWYRPDWLYGLEGVQPPTDSLARLVPDAFGPGEVFLGAGISIHGRVKDVVPSEAVDHTFLELDTVSLKAVVRTIQPGSQVFIQ